MSLVNTIFLLAIKIPNTLLILKGVKFVFLTLIIICAISCNKTSSINGSNKTWGKEKIENHLKIASNRSIKKEIRLAHLDSVLEETKFLKKDTIKRSILSTVANSYYRLGELDTSYKINKEILRLSSSIDDSIGLGKSTYDLGLYYSSVDKLDSAYSYFFRSEKIYNTIGDELSAGEALLAMAITQKNVKDYVGSEANSVKAVQLLQKINNKRYLASAYNNLGTVSRRLGNFDEAINYYKISQDYRRELDNNSILLVGSLNNIGTVYTDKKYYAAAISHFNEALTYDSLQYNKPKTYARLLDNLAYAKYLSGDINTFPDLFFKALHIRDSVNDRLGSVTSNLRIARVYHDKGDTAHAKEYVYTAYQKAKQATYNDGILESLNLLMKVSPPQEGIAYGEEYIRISDSLQKEERAFQNKFARIRYETDTLEVEKEKATRTTKRLSFILLVFVILFLIVYIFIQRRSARKELEYQEGQQKSNEEIYGLMLAQQSKLEEGKHIEKLRISEELHDGILSRLFGIRLSLDSLNRKQGDDIAIKREAYLEELKELGQEIRQISHDLNDAKFTADTVFPDVLMNLLKEQCGPYSLSYDLISDPDINWEEISNAKKIHVYRIIQESLTNIKKHAKAENVTVIFEKIDSGIELTIEDDGIGMETSKVKSGIGLKNIKSRVTKIAGSYNFNSKIGDGTQIKISF